MRRVDRMTKAAVAALEDIKGREIVVLDVTPMSGSTHTPAHANSLPEQTAKGVSTS